MEQHNAIDLNRQPRVLIERIQETLAEVRRLPSNRPDHMGAIIDDIEEGLARLVQDTSSVNPPDSGYALVVDGFESSAVQTAEVLQDLGWCVQVRSTGEEALARLATSERFPDCVWLEVLLEGDVHGPELMRRLSRLYPSLPVVVLTAFNSETGAFEAGRLGAAGYCTKPLTKEAVVSALQQVAGKKDHESGQGRAESRKLSEFLRERVAGFGGVKKLSRESGLAPERVEVCLERADGVRVVDMVLLLTVMGVGTEELCERVCREVPPAVAQDRRAFRALEGLIRGRLRLSDDQYLSGVLGLGRNELSRCLLGDDPRWFQAVLVSAHHGNVGLEELLAVAFPASLEALDST